MCKWFYLHLKGVAHRDIKPENLLIDRKCRLVIADFGFSIQLPPKDQSFSMLPSILQQQIGATSHYGAGYERYVMRNRMIGSEDYNQLFSDANNYYTVMVVSEELFSDISLEQEIKQKSEHDDSSPGGGKVIGFSHSSGLSKSTENIPFKFNQGVSLYDPMKADLFSAATTLFMMVMRCPPFRKAHQKDPYFKRLCAADRKPFWNIFKGIPISPEFKELFEGVTRRDPEERFSLKHIVNHPWFMNGDRLDENDLKIEVRKRFDIVEKSGIGMNQNEGKHHVDQSEQMQELLQKDQEEFEQLRQTNSEEIRIVIGKRIKHRIELAKAKKHSMLQGQLFAGDQIQASTSSKIEPQKLKGSSPKLKEALIKSLGVEEEIEKQLAEGLIFSNEDGEEKEKAPQSSTQRTSSFRLYSFDE